MIKLLIRVRNKRIECVLSILWNSWMKYLFFVFAPDNFWESNARAKSEGWVWTFCISTGKHTRIYSEHYDRTQSDFNTIDMTRSVREFIFASFWTNNNKVKHLWLFFENTHTRAHTFPAKQSIIQHWKSVLFFCSLFQCISSFRVLFYPFFRSFWVNLFTLSAPDLSLGKVMRETPCEPSTWRSFIEMGTKPNALKSKHE